MIADKGGILNIVSQSCCDAVTASETLLVIN